MDKCSVYKKAIDVIRESTEWGEDVDNKVFANYVIGVINMADTIVGEIEDKEMNS